MYSPLTLDTGKHWLLRQLTATRAWPLQWVIHEGLEECLPLFVKCLLGPNFSSRMLILCREHEKQSRPVFFDLHTKLKSRLTYRDFEVVTSGLILPSTFLWMDYMWAICSVDRWLIISKSSTICKVLVILGLINCSSDYLSRRSDPIFTNCDNIWVGTVCARSGFCSHLQGLRKGSLTFINEFIFL